MRARYERYDKHGKKRRLILFSLLGVALVVSYSLRPFSCLPRKPARHGPTNFGKKRHHYRQGGTHENATRPSYPSQQALTVLEKLRAYSGGNQYVFPSYCSETILFGKNALSRAIRRMGFE